CFGVLEPRGSDVVSLEDISVMVVPGIAFDLSGHRLGYGRGFYDRVLHSASTLTATVGFAYDFQVVPMLPSQPHDQPLSHLVTESRIIECSA
ncbi:MAG: 5-formyltetrahydrofolate cyclo-ligase, partial [Desulfuromonadales bacterium]|nr:5-formyltetrahydrofolate cyclo-ligase [Desulfuromonadales bacterium]